MVFDLMLGSIPVPVILEPAGDSTQIRPPWRSATALQIARPIPLPSYSAAL
jgi:hypothetical protein